jgi:hypothetical protein
MVHPTRSRRNNRERGQTMILVAISLISLLAVAALAIDVVTLYVARSETQRAADAAAIAGAKAVADSGVTTLNPADPQLPAAEVLARTMATSAVSAMLSANPAINQVAGTQPVLVLGSPTVTFPGGATPPNSNPHVTVALQVTTLPTFFARIWGNRTATVTATATAEAYNPANVPIFNPVAPRAVKPWLIANADPTTGSLIPPQFVNPANGAVEVGVIGEQFYLHSDCPTAAPGCSLTDNPPTVPASSKPVHLQVDYVPAQVTAPLVPNPNVCPACAAGATDYEQSIGCADMTTSYQVLSCGGGAAKAQWDNTVNPGGALGLSELGTECLTHALGTGNSGQDTLIQPVPLFSAPMQITAQGPPQSGNVVTTSNSIVTIPIIDTTNPIPATGGAVTIDGYMQAFINEVHGGGNPNRRGDILVTVLNVAGCSSAPNAAAPIVGGTGTSPVPVRLITPP